MDLDLQERFRHLKENEKMKKYQCPDYAVLAHPSNCTNEKKEVCLSRMNSIMDFRHQTLLKLWGFSEQNLCVDGVVMSTAAFIFDRYLSTFVPSFVHSESSLPCKGNLIGVASLFIAAKSLMSREGFHPVEEFFCYYSREVFVEQVEWKILKALKWDIVYPSPISIINDLITLLPRPCDFQEHYELLEAYEGDVLNEAAHLTKMAAVRYGFNIKYHPSTIALAAMGLALENQPVSANIAIFNVANNPIVHFGIMFERCGLGLSFSDEDVKRCRGEMFCLLENRSKTETQTKRRYGSLTNVTQVPCNSAV